MIEFIILTIAGTFVGATAGTICGCLLTKSYKEKMANDLLSFFTDMDSPIYLECEFGEEGIKWDKLSERTENVMNALPPEDRREFFVKLVSNKNFEEYFRTVSEYEKKLDKLNNKEK